MARILFLAVALGVCLATVAVDAQLYQRQHSLQKPYFGSGLDIPFWDFGGSTVVSSDYVRLTPDRQSKRGMLWNNIPSNMGNWEMSLEFRVHGQGTRLFGDGFAFFYAKEKMQAGPVFGNRDEFTGLAIFFDTYSNHNGVHNHRHPYVSAMVNNGKQKYDHDADGTHNVVAGCEFFFRNLDQPTRVRIAYQDRTLTVHQQIGATDWDKCFQTENVYLPVGYYFGFTAATGEVADNHDIISVRTSQLTANEPEDALSVKNEVPFIASIGNEKDVPRAPHEADREHVDPVAPIRTASVTGVTIIVVEVVAGLLVVFLVVVFARMKMKERAAKRFT